MSTRSRVVLSLLAAVLVTGLGAAHWVVTNLAVPDYSACRGATGVFLADFGRDSEPTARKACFAGEAMSVTVRADRGTGEVVVEAPNASLLRLDGVRDPGRIAMHVNSIDHSRDMWWVRLLDAATPFADFDPIEPYGSDEEHAYRTVEVGQPRATSTPDGSRLTIELGSHLDDETLSVFIVERGRDRGTR